MRGKYYRLKSHTLAIQTSEDNQRVPITLPEGAMVQVLTEMNGNRLIDVVWEGKTVMMFTIDLRNRGVRYDPESALISG